MPFPTEKNAIVFRCRIHDPKNIGKHFTGIKDFGYRRTDVDLIGMGRGNIPGQSVGYYSQKMLGGIVECIQGRKEGEILEATISKWMLTDSLSLFCVVEPNPSRRTLRHAEQTAIEEWYDKHTSTLAPEEKEVFDHYFSFMNVQWISPSKEGYYITSAYARLCYDIRDGVAYTSVIKSDSFNIAVKSSLEDEGRIKLQTVLKAKFKILIDDPQREEDIELLDSYECNSLSLDRRSCTWFESRPTMSEKNSWLNPTDGFGKMEKGVVH